jgi:hypothetical protein
MARQHSTDKAMHIIGMIRSGKLSLGEVQSHTSIEMTKKYGHKHDSPIVLTEHQIRGTGIPASTLKKFASFSVTMRQRSITKLAAFHDRLQYMRLKQVGASRPDRKSILKESPKTVEKAIVMFKRGSKRWYRQRVAFTSKHERMPKLYEIRHGMAHSKEEWYEYMLRLLDYQKRTHGSIK